jgi:hypothetical protein
MGTKKIIAYFMHEAEEAAAWEKMSNVEGTESFLLGEIEEEDILTLKEQGIIVQELEDQGLPAPDELELDVGVEPGIRDFDLEGIAPEIGDRESDYYLLHISGPLLSKWRSELESLDVELLERVPPNQYIARLTPAAARQARDLNYILDVREYGSAQPPSKSTVRFVSPPSAEGPDKGRRMVTYDVRLHKEAEPAKVLGWLAENGVDVAGSTKRKIRVYLIEDAQELAGLARLPEVAAVEEYVPPELHNRIARGLLGLDTRESEEVVPVIPQTGAGEIVGVADTGLDGDHPDFQGRLVGLVALGRDGDPSDPHGHGTHVAGSVLGDGSASAGELQGAAPRASLFFQSLLDSRGGLGGLPLDLGELFEEAYQAGARIHNNSWGAATRSMYTFNSIEVDEFVARRRDMLVVISAGNEGQAAECRHSAPGFVDWLSIGSPASSKNALTVGARRSSRESGGIANLKYSQVWPAKFPDTPIAEETVSGNPEALAAFSSRGPCDDHRIKPDLVAPGTDIASAKSSLAPLRNFWGPYPNNGNYAFMGGTSMAAPLVSGCAALVREYFGNDRDHHPSAALLKATLINSTRWLSAPDSVADHERMPNFHQGFGSLYMPWAIPNPSVPEMALEFIDPWQQPEDHFSRTGQRFRFSFSHRGGEFLRVCLAWTDLPGRGLQNNLNLFLEHRDSGQKWIGNENLPLALTQLDPDNNVEIVRLENPPAGEYMIQVSASNLLSAGQDYALVVTGDLGSELVEF